MISIIFLKNLWGQSLRMKNTEKLVRALYDSIDRKDINSINLYLKNLIDLTNENNEDVIMAEMLLKRKGITL